MDRNEKESFHVAMILTALLAFACGMAVGATVVDRLKVQSESSVIGQRSVERKGWQI